MKDLSPCQIQALDMYGEYSDSFNVNIKQVLVFCLLAVSLITLLKGTLYVLFGGRV